MSFYEFAPLDVNGNPYDFHQLEKKVVIVVNVASKCGLTPQYGELEQLYREFKEDGLEIIAFPCNQFGQQEPRSEREIVEFCQTKYGVTYPIFYKVEVNGSGTIPLYEWLKNEKSGVLGFKGIKWNFEKFLIDRTGKVRSRYGSITAPLSLRNQIRELLDEEH